MVSSCVLRCLLYTSYILLDEIQEVDGWEKVVNSLLVDLDTDIYVTGSNSVSYTHLHLNKCIRRNRELLEALEATGWAFWIHWLTPLPVSYTHLAFC